MSLVLEQNIILRDRVFQRIRYDRDIFACDKLIIEYNICTSFIFNFNFNILIFKFRVSVRVCFPCIFLRVFISTNALLNLLHFDNSSLKLLIFRNPPKLTKLL